jgi:hypothetical protein
VPDADNILEEAGKREERAVLALEKLADALTVLATLSQRVVDRDYPVRTEPRDATITRIPTTEDRLRADQGATGETEEEWLELGPRERELLKPR